MKILMSAVFAAGTLLVPAALPAIAATHVAIACPADAPEAWKRAGGYCEQIQSLDTIGTEKGSGNGSGNDCPLVTMVQPVLVDGRVHVAGVVDPCYVEPPPPPCASLGSSAFDLLPEGMLLKSDAVELFACD